MGRIIAIHDVAYNKQSVSNKLIRQILDYGSLLPASMRDRWKQIGAFDYLAGDADYVFLSLYDGLDDSEYGIGFNKSAFWFDAEHLIKLGAIVRDYDLLDDYFIVAEDAALEIINFDVTGNRYKNIEDHVDVLDLIQCAVMHNINSRLDPKALVDYSGKQAYPWYKKLAKDGLISPMLDAVHCALVEYKKQYNHVGKDAIRELHNAMDHATGTEILWHGPLPLLYALPESPAFRVK